MNKRFGCLVAGVLLLAGTSAIAASGVVDMIAFGNRASEEEHRLKAAHSEVMEGALGLPARRFLPQEKSCWRGGNAVFDMAVDPDKSNYVTAKFWGGGRREKI